MKKRRFIILVILSVLLSVEILAQEKLMDILRGELREQMDELKKEEFPPYYINYRIVDQTTNIVKASFGALSNSESHHSKVFLPQIRIGDSTFDNFKESSQGASVSRLTGVKLVYLPIDYDNNEESIKQIIWGEVCKRYKYACETLEKSKAKKNVKVEREDKSPDFTPVIPIQFYEPPLSKAQTRWDKKTWEDKTKRYSSVFLKSPHIISGDAIVSFKIVRKYFLSTEGTEIAENLTYAIIQIRGVTKADDGMELPLILSYFAFTPADLPGDEEIIRDVNKMIDRLENLRKAPIVQPYTGPALLSGSASAVFFHEIFGHRIEGQRMKSESDGQTFKKMVGELVLPEDMSVYDDPTLSKYNKKALNGYYKYDEQGVKGEKVVVVKDGVLRNFLMTRVAIEGFPESNGHGRADLGYDPVSRQSNLIVEVKDPKTNKELRKGLIAEAKKQDKEYAYLFKKVTGGFTQTGRRSPNAFNVTPLEVYKIYVDGRHDELVRGVDLIGTPLSMFSNIIQSGGESEIFTGTCGAESGGVPVTAISPVILVNKVEMQRKAKSQELPPILERP